MFKRKIIQKASTDNVPTAADTKLQLYDNNDSVQSVVPIADPDVIVTVHAPENEFGDSEVESEESNDDNDDPQSPE